MNNNLYKQKKAEVHTPAEIKSAFEESFAICFDFNENRTPTTRSSMFTSIWMLNPDAFIVECDLCVMSTEPKAHRDQFLLINRNGTKESANEILRLMEESDSITSAYCFFSEKKAGIKGCYCRVFGNDKPSVVKKGIF